VMSVHVALISSSTLTPSFLYGKPVIWAPTGSAAART
jgi:hypothetical protein